MKVPFHTHTKLAMDKKTWWATNSLRTSIVLPARHARIILAQNFPPECYYKGYDFRRTFADDEPAPPLPYSRSCCRSGKHRCTSSHVHQGVCDKSDIIRRLLSTGGKLWEGDRLHEIKTKQKRATLAWLKPDGGAASANRYTPRTSDRTRPGRRPPRIARPPERYRR